MYIGVQPTLRGGNGARNAIKTGEIRVLIVSIAPEPRAGIRFVDRAVVQGRVDLEVHAGVGDLRKPFRNLVDRRL